MLRADVLRVAISANEHTAAHVHVFGNGEVKFGLAGPEGTPVLLGADGMSRSEVRRAGRLVAEQQALLRQRWEDIQG